ncbi:hypothetical protein D3C86_1660330 [compost metagenome]
MHVAGESAADVRQMFGQELHKPVLVPEVVRLKYLRHFRRCRSARSGRFRSGMRGGVVHPGTPQLHGRNSARKTMHQGAF